MHFFAPYFETKTADIGSNSMKRIYLFCSAALLLAAVFGCSSNGKRDAQSSTFANFAVRRSGRVRVAMLGFYSGNGCNTSPISPAPLLGQRRSEQSHDCLARGSAHFHVPAQLRLRSFNRA